MNKELRKQQKKLRQYQEKNPDIQDDEYHELRRKVISIKVQIEKSNQKKLELQEKLEERNKFNNLTDEEALEQAFQENASINSKNRKAEKNKAKRIKKKKEIQEKKEAEEKKIYDEVIQPQIAKYIIMSIVQNV